MKYAFVVAYTDNYIKGVTALENSIKKWMPDADILKLHGQTVEDTAIGRFKYAVDNVDKYDAICLMDADMFLTADPTRFFDVASKGFIVTGSNGMIINFNNEYQAKYQVDLGTKDYPYPEIHTSVPIFINRENIDWFDELFNSRRIDSWDDFLYLNILGIKMGKDKKMIVMPPYTFTGIHHWQMKPETSVIKRGELLLSGTEERIYMVHGKWWDEAWLQDLMPTMEKYLKDNEMGNKNIERVKDSIKLIKQEFNNYS